MATIRFRESTLLAAAFALAPHVGAYAATYYASPTGTNNASCTAADPGTVQTAVNKAVAQSAWTSGDEVLLLPGTYDFSGSEWSGKNAVDIKSRNYLTIRSSSGDRGSVRLVGAGPGAAFFARAFNAECLAKIQDLTVSNFFGNSAGVAAYSKTKDQLRLVNCIVACNTGTNAAIAYTASADGCLFSANTNRNGTGVCYNTSLITNCTFIANAASVGGGASHSYAVDCLFSNNVATSYAGAFDGNTSGGNSSQYTARRCTFVGNLAAGGGGAVAYAIVDACTFIGNSCPSNKTGGAILASGAATDCTFIGNCAGTGGALSGGTSTRCLFQDNAALAICGAIYLGHAYDCDFIGNSSGGSGGAVYVWNQTISGCLFSNNWAKTSAGAVQGSASGILITNCLFVMNSAATGGAVGVYDDRPIRNSVFIGNVATNGANGAVANAICINCRFENNFATTQAGAGSMSGYNCEFIGNSSGGSAGAVYMWNYTLSGCLFSNNYANTSGGALTGSKSSNSITGCLFVNNSAASGGAIGSFASRSLSDSTFIGNVATNGNAGAVDSANSYRCVFEGNRATGTGAAAYGASINDCLVISNQALKASGYIVTASANNCTFEGNQGVDRAATQTATVNCLFHANLPYDIGGGAHKNALYGTKTGSPTFTDSIQTNAPRYNAGKDRKAPWFAPSASSLARDAGMDRGYSANAVDLAGRLRLNGPVDIGCYEYWNNDLATIFEVR